jgi:pyruvate, water dikinase
VKAMIAQAVHKAKSSGSKIGICGQAPSDYPEFAKFLVGLGIDSISVTPDVALKTKTIIADAEIMLVQKS